MLLRPGSTEDLDAILALVRNSIPLMRAAGNLQWDDEYPNREVFAQDAATGQLWVVESNARIAAVAAFTTEQEEEYVHVGWNLDEEALVVHRLAVDPAYRGQGLADRLMQQAEQVARERGIAILRGDTNTENATASRLFARMGYTLAGETGLGFRPGLRFLCYEKRLSQP